MVNPRKAGQNYTGFSFPSKTIDYLLAGRPIINYPLEGIPEEYQNYLDYVNNDEEMKCRIEYYLNLSEEEINIIGERNFSFITSKKNSKVQCKKIMVLFDKIRKERRAL